MDDGSPVVLTLYVAAESSRGQRAIRRLHELVGDRPDCEIHVVDVVGDPQAAEDARILATPALVKESPPPVRRVVGDLSDGDALMQILDLPESRS